MRLVPTVALLSVAFVVACSSAPSGSAGAFPEAPLASLPTAGTQLGVEVRSAPAQPPARGLSELELRVHDGAGAPRDGLAISVTPVMAAHGHGAPGSPVVAAIGEGRYLVSELQLPMSGTWELRLALRGEGGFEDHATASIEVR